MKSSYVPGRAEQEVMADYIVDSVIGDATGVAEGERCVGEPPSARYYLSALAPRDVDFSAGTVRRGRVVPTSAGFEFEAENSSVLGLMAECSVYYRVFPTYAEQLAKSDPDASPADRHDRAYRLSPVFARCAVQLPELRADVDAAQRYVPFGSEAFAAAFDQARSAITSDPRAYRRADNATREIDVPGDALATVEAFDQWIASLAGTVPMPTWSAQLSISSRPAAESRQRVIVMVENLSVDPVRVVREQSRHDNARDHFLFRVGLRARAVEGRIVAMRMNLGPDAYRYDPLLAAYATNCGVNASVDGNTVRELSMTPSPVHTTYRMPSTDHPATSFGTLVTDPLPALVQLGEDMAAYARHPDWSVSGLPIEQAARKRADQAAFEHEVARYREGLRWLERDERLLHAFRLANETMLQLNESGDRSFVGWRVFQLVFIVSHVPALAWREHDPDEFTPGLWGDPVGRDPTAAATVLWFPTGQGKTEAYLGLMAVALFFDRLRGKTRGITAWCRFPLRLLSLQQTERQLMFVAAAEEVRSRSIDRIRSAGGDPGDPFAVGFYVGEGNTPNTLSRDENTLNSFINDPRKRMAQRVIDRCPFCGKRSIEIPPPDPTALRLIHRCTSCNRDLPVIVVDTEIYRYLPAVVVGTIDKLAMIGLSDRFGALLGDVDCECTLHGFGRGMKCHERRAPGHPARGTVAALATPLYDPSPTLEILDELHMVDEELGAFAGHYEGMLAVAQQELTRRQRPDGRAVRMKIVCTSATIEGEDRQSEHLFGLPSVVVPLPGPTLRGSFYWELRDDQPLRRFVGVMPHRATSEQTMARILQAYHRAIRRLESEGRAALPALSHVPDADFIALVDLYRVSLTYVTSLVDFGKLRRTMESQVNEHLRSLGLASLAVRELSGDTPFDAVRATLDDLQQRGGQTEAVIGTSMVSHGVDIDRLNVMLFNGMPKAMAEYIQASSRVGRVVLGVVFMIFNPVRERDRSHFRYHAKFHEYLDRMVEPVAINRWSRYAARKTMPGLLMAGFLQIANRDYWEAGGAPRHLHDLTRVKEALRLTSAGGIESAQRDSMLETLGRAYLFDRDGATEIRGEVTQDLDTALGSLRAAGAAASVGARGRPTYRGTPDYLGLRYDPMLSLRDVAEGVPFIILAPRRKP
jgi:Helicase conserved C-terminal domain